MPSIESGILKRHQNRSLLFNPEQSLEVDKNSVVVPESLIQKYKLIDGATVEGPVSQTKKGIILEEVTSICGLEPEKFKARIPYTRLTAITPHQRFNLSITGDMSMRVVDMMAPIAKGTRGLIVSPPRAGKTMLLEQIARSVHQEDPNARIIVLLIDERPEEVTHFRRSLKAEVMASSNDMDTRTHVALTELVMAHVTAELECGKNVVVLVDSLTRMARAFNLKGSSANKGKIMSGGIQAGTMEIPRRFFGMARCIEGGGSVTIIATVLVDTGSRMDQLIFEEFKGTGNSEIILDRRLAEARVFPALNLPASGTRREELLYPPDQHARITQVRRILSKTNTKEGMELLLKLLNKFPTNDEFLKADLRN